MLLIIVGSISFFSYYDLGCGPSNIPHLTKQLIIGIGSGPKLTKTNIIVYYLVTLQMATPKHKYTPL